MGSAASIKFQHTRNSFANVQDAYFQKLLSSKSAREQLFKDIAAYKPEDRIELKNKISLKKLVWYFTDGNHTLYPGFVVNVPVLSEAFKYTIKKTNKMARRTSAKTSTKVSSKTSSKSAKLFCGSSKSKKSHTVQNLSKKMFHEFLPVLLLFVRLWDLFDSADKLVVEDQRIFKHEFFRIQDRLCADDGISIVGKASRDAWEKEFNIMDRDGNGYIEFDEACAYAIRNIKEPFNYGDDVEEDDEDDEGDGERDSVSEKDSREQTTPRETLNALHEDSEFRTGDSTPNCSRPNSKHGPLVEVVVHETGVTAGTGTSSSDSQATVDLPMMYLTPDYGAPTIDALETTHNALLPIGNSNLIAAGVPPRTGTTTTGSSIDESDAPRDTGAAKHAYIANGIAMAAAASPTGDIHTSTSTVLSGVISTDKPLHVMSPHPLRKSISDVEGLSFHKGHFIFV